MGKWYVVFPMLGMLAVALWFAGSAWIEFAGDIPLYGYIAIVGGVLISLLLGGGLMALAFYSDTAGFDDRAGGDRGPQ